MSPATVPHDVGAEEAVIASLLVAADKLPAVRERVAAEDFHDWPCHLTYDAILRIADRGEQVNQITVTHELSTQPRGGNGTSRTALDDVGGMVFLSKIVLELPTPIGVESYADIVRRNATLRQLLSVSAQISDMASKGGAEVDEIMRRAEVLIASISGATTATGEPYTATSLDELLDQSDDDDDAEVFVSDGADGAVLSRDAKLAVAAGTGVGKTNMLMRWSCALCGGTSFLGLSIPAPLSVLYVSLEGSTRNTRRRLRKAWAGSTAEARARFTIAKLDRLDIMDPADLMRLDALIAEHKPDVLIIDPLRHAHGLDENDNTAMALVTAVLDGMMARHNCALILAHHDRKRPPFTKRDTGTDRVRGASSFTGWLTSCLTLDRDPSGPDRFLAEWVKTRDAEEALEPLTLDFDRATLDFSIAERTTDGAVTEDMVLTAIWRDGGTVRGKDLVQGFVEGAGARGRSVRDVIRKLVDDGRLEAFIADEDRKAGAKSYRLPDGPGEEPQELPGVGS